MISINSVESAINRAQFHQFSGESKTRDSMADLRESNRRLGFVNKQPKATAGRLADDIVSAEKRALDYMKRAIARRRGVPSGRDRGTEGIEPVRGRAGFSL